MSMTRRKYYTVQITEKPGARHGNIWYAGQQEKQFKTVLAVAENTAGSLVPVFKCVEAPFFHIYPDHCTIVKEETVN